MLRAWCLQGGLVIAHSKASFYGPATWHCSIYRLKRISVAVGFLVLMIVVYFWRYLNVLHHPYLFQSVLCLLMGYIQNFCGYYSWTSCAFLEEMKILEEKPGEDNAGDYGVYLWLKYHAQHRVRITVHGKRSYNHGKYTVDQCGSIKH